MNHSRILWLSAIFFVAHIPQVHAATINVATNDPGIGQAQCSLRDAIEAANTDAPSGGCPAGSGADTIAIGAMTYSLNHGTAVAGGSTDLLIIHSEITLTGQGAVIESQRVGSLIRVEGDPAILHASGLTIQSSQVGIKVFGATANLNDVRVLDNSAGGIHLYNDANLHLVNSVVSKNQGPPHTLSGILVEDNSEAIIENSEITNNEGGIGCETCNGRPSSIKIKDSVVKRNGSSINASNASLELINTKVSGGSRYGGAMICGDLPTKIVNSTLSGSLVGSGRASALSAGSRTVVLNSTISNNKYGGLTGGSPHPAVYAKTGAKIINTTISGNIGYGVAGVIAESGVEIINSTIANNSFGTLVNNPAPITAGLSGDVTLINTIISNNSGVADCSGSLTPSSTNNLISDGSCGASFSGDPFIGPLGDNGGPTHTHALLLPRSAAVDGGNDSYCSGPGVNGTDQRGAPRPQDGDGDGVSACDIGAFELGDAPSVCESTYPLPNNQWRQISLPCNPGKASSVSAVFGDDIVGSYGTDWIVYRYDSGGYVPLSELDALSQGVGYWIIQKSGGEVTLEMSASDNSTSTPITNPVGCLGTAQGCFEIPLLTQANTTQWNMIGYPFASAGGLGGARVVATPSPCTSGCDLNGAESHDIVHNQFWSYDGTSYTKVDTSGNLDPWKGYWVATLNQASGTSPRLLVPKL
jgi:hypothetical protein